MSDRQQTLGIQAGVLMAEIVWPVELLEMLALLQERERASDDLLKAAPFPKGAEPSAVEAAEKALGARFDTEHRAFLLHADGWDRVASPTNLFSTEDFRGSDRFVQAQKRLSKIPARALGQHAAARKGLIPISRRETEIVAMIRTDAQIGPRVLWFSDDKLIDEYESFPIFFAGLKELVREDIELCHSQLGGGGVGPST